MTDSKRSPRAAKTTIVGGQPPGNSRELPPIPVGLEELLGMAAAEQAFAEVLLDDPAAAADAGGLTLTATEATILRAVGRETLSQMIARLRQRQPETERRAFLEQAAAALAVVVGGAAAASGCKGQDKSASKSTTPSTTPGTAPTSTPTSTPPRAPSTSSPTETGVRPDRPPSRDAGVGARERPRPMQHRPTRGIRPRPSTLDPHDTRGTGARPDRPLKIPE
ncbi:MAG: hypothetical protein ABI333_18170 [bacterium]